MRPLLKNICISALLLGILATSAEGKRLKIVTTLPSLASITEQIAGDHADISSITRGSQDAHYIQAKPSYMVQLSRADLLIYSGMELEIGWLPLLLRGCRNNKVAVGEPGNLNASSALDAEDILERPRGELDRSMGDVHPMGNPHYLLNPHLSLKVARLIADRLGELDPSNGQDYDTNYSAYETNLQQTLEKVKQERERLRGAQIVCYHPHWNYLVDWLGLQNRGYIEDRPGIPPTPKHKMEIIQLMKRHSIPIVGISSWKEPTKAREVARSCNARLVVLPGEVGALSGAEDYLDWIEYLVNELADAYDSAQAERGHGRHRHRVRGN